MKISALMAGFVFAVLSTFGWAQAPVITTHPISSTGTAGASATFTVAASGPGPLSYQWRKFGQPISNATTATLSLSGIGLLDAALYDVQVGAGSNVTTSSAARLTVTASAYSDSYRVRSGFAPNFETYGAALSIVPVPGGGFYALGNFTTIGGELVPGVARFLASGGIDPSFRSVPMSGPVRAAVLQPDGKLVIAGEFGVVGGQSRLGIARLNSDGTLDPTLNPGSGASTTVTALALQSDGKIVVGGLFANFNGAPVGNIVRLNGDGTRDTTFVTGTGFGVGAANAVNALVVDNNIPQRILVGGVFTRYNGVTTNVGRIARLSATGALDTAFGANIGNSITGNVTSLAVYPASSPSNAGKIVVGGSFTGATRSNLTRLNADGTVDSGFMATGAGFNGTVNKAVIQPDDKVVVVGAFTSLAGVTLVTRNRIARLNGTDGSVDASFYPTVGLNSTGNAVALTTDNKVVIGGSFTSVGGVARVGIARLDGTTGAVDSSVTATLRQPGLVYTVVPAAGGKWIVGGDFDFLNQSPANNLVRLNADGTPDPTFASGSGPNSLVNAIVTQADDKIIIGGGFSNYNGTTRAAIARINANGTLDPTFTPGTGFNGTVNTLALQADSKVVVGGSFTTFAGTIGVNRIARLNADGTLDSMFASAAGGGFDSTVRSVSVQPDGRLVVSGDFTTYNGTPGVNHVARLMAGGALDAAFTSATGTGHSLASLRSALQSDGKILLYGSGATATFNGQTVGGLSRLTSAGALDTAFHSSGSGFGGLVLGASVQSDGKVSTAGNFPVYSGRAVLYYARLDGTNGTLDTTFSVPTAHRGSMNSSPRLSVFFHTADGSLMVGGGRLDFAERTASGLVLLEGVSNPPAITTQPVAQSVIAGNGATLSVVATSSAPLTFQWRKDGVNLAGATSATYVIASAQLADAGSYSVAVTNSAGTVTSTAAVLAVTRNYSGTYFGTFDGGRGNWALVVRSDGTGTYVAFLTNPKGGIVATVTIAADGTFRVASTLLQPESGVQSIGGRAVAAAAGIPVTLSGAIGTTTVTGALEGAGVTFTGALDPPVGETAAISGLYKATAAATTTYTAVGSSRQVLALAIGPTLVDGGLGTIASNGTFSITTADKTQINGTVTAVTSTITGNVTPDAGPTISVTGSATVGLGPPTIASAPGSRTAATGSTVVLAVVASGTTPLIYQWKKNGVDLRGATSATYAIAAAQLVDAGNYTCFISNSEGNITTSAAGLTVIAPSANFPGARLVNLSIRTTIRTAGDTFTLGYVVGGEGTAGPKPFLVRAAGPSLGALGVSDTLDDPKLELFVGVNKTGENDNWGGSTELSAAFAGVGAFPYTAVTSRDAAIVNPVATPENSVRISAVGNGTGEVIAELYDAASSDVTAPRLVNVSVLKHLGAGLTAGFVIGGTGNKSILIRAIGPTLAAVFNLEGAVADPQLTLFSGPSAISSNDNWGGSVELTAAFTTVAAFPLAATSRDSALLATLPPGAYTVQVSGVAGGTGEALVEIYEVP